MHSVPRPRNPETTMNAIWRLLVRLALVGLLIYAGYRLRNIATTLFVAAIIAYVLDPLVEWLATNRAFVQAHTYLTAWATNCQTAYERSILRHNVPSQKRIGLKRHVVRVYASLYVFVLAIFLLWQGTRLIVTPFVQEIRKATSAEGQRKIKEQWALFETNYNEGKPEWAKTDKIKDSISKVDFAKKAQEMAGTVSRSLFDSLKNVVEIVLLPVLAFYFLIDGRKLKHEFISLLPRPRIREAMRMTREFNQIMRAFVAGQFILCVLAGVVVGVGLALIHVPYPLTLGLFAGLTRAIPIVGPILGGIPIIILTLITQGTGAALAVLVFFTFLHFAESKFIMPMLIGDRMELHPVIIIVVLIVGQELGGVLMGGQIGALLGMFFAAPLASIARIAIRRYWLRLRPRSRPMPPSAPPIPVATKTAPAILSELAE